jgi:hypothetical protein
MDKENWEYILEEITSSVDRWSELALQALNRGMELNNRNSDREFNLYLAATSLSAAFLTIVVPLLKNDLSIPLIFAAFFSLITTIMGIASLMVTIARDKRLVNEDALWEHSVIKRYLDQAVAIRAKLYEYKKKQSDELWDKITSEFEQYFNSRKGLSQEADERKLQKSREPVAIWLKRSAMAFWISAALTVLFLVVWLVYQIIPLFFKGN